MVRNQPRPVRTGIAGAGWVAQARHAPAFQRDGRAELVAVYDRYPERAAALARRFGIPKACRTREEFFDQRLDVVSICTSPWTHADLAVESLRQGCHAFVEKPMALDTAEAAEMVRAADEASRLLCVSHNFLFSRSMRRAKALIQGGDVGQIRHVMAVQSSNPHRRLPKWYADLPGGLFFDESPHMVYLLQYLLGPLRIEHVRAQVASPERKQPLDSIEVLLAGPDATASLSMVFVAPVSEWLIVVFGERRALAIDLFRDILTVMRPDRTHSLRDVLRSSAQVFAQQIRGFVSSGALYATNRLLYGHEALIRGFLDSVVDGGPPPVTSAEAFGVLQTMEQILGRFPEAPSRRQPLRAG